MTNDTRSAADRSERRRRRTPQVDGTITLDGTTLTSADIVADFTALVSDESRRDDAVQRALDTGAHPAATFTLTDPVELDALPT